MSVLVTRPEPQATELVVLLKDLGIAAAAFPAIQTQPLESPAVLLSQLPLIQEADYWIFISPRAVQAAVDILGSWPPSSARVCAIGHSTQEALHQTGCSSVLVSKNACSEGLLDLLSNELIQRQKVVIFRGGEGRHFLKKSLEGRGALVHYLDTYQRLLPPIKIASLNAYRQAHPIDLVVFSSLAGAQHFWGEVASKSWDLSNVTFTIMGDRMKDWAKQQKLRHTLPLLSGRNSDIAEQIHAFYKAKNHD